jgi:hypothetical protein
MEFWKAILGLLRRRLLILPLLGCTIAIAVTAFYLTPPRYASSTTMVLTAPASGGTLSEDPNRPTSVTNPMLTFTNDLKTASAILIYAMNTPEVAAELGVVDGGPTGLTIDDGRTNPEIFSGNGPFVYIAAESTSAAEAKKVVVRAQERIRQELVDRQKSLGAPPETYLTLIDVVGPASPKVILRNRIKVGAIALVLSFLIGLGAAYAWHRLPARRNRREVGRSQVDREDNEQEWSWKSDLEDPEQVAMQTSESRRNEILDTQPTDGGQIEDFKRDAAASDASNVQAADQRIIDDELDRASVRNAAAEDQAGNEDRPADREEVVAHPEQATETVISWKLYHDHFSVAHGVSQSSSVDLGLSGERDQEGLDSERSPEVMRRQRKGWPNGGGSEPHQRSA